MNITAEIEISRPKEVVWDVITDIENWTGMVTNIINVRILNKPAQGIAGLKWEETRRMFGVQATETLWVTDFVENEYYCSRGESHGSIFTTRFTLRDRNDRTLLTISFDGQARSSFIRTLSFWMEPLINNAILNVLQKDLEDIRNHAEKR